MFFHHPFHPIFALFHFAASLLIAALVFGFLARRAGFAFAGPWGCRGRDANALFKDEGRGCGRSRRQDSAGVSATGNAAFDSYKAETLKKLEAEADEFRAYLNGLKNAADKAEFDCFMDERRKQSGQGGPILPLN